MWSVSGGGLEGEELVRMMAGWLTTRCFSEACSGARAYVLFFPHRCLAAFRAISRRCSGLSFAALALPPFNPPNRPSAWAWGFFSGSSICFPACRPLQVLHSTYPPSGCAVSFRQVRGWAGSIRVRHEPQYTRPLLICCRSAADMGFSLVASSTLAAASWLMSRGRLGLPERFGMAQHRACHGYSVRSGFF